MLVPVSAWMLLYFLFEKKIWLKVLVSLCVTVLFFIGYASKDINRDHPFYETQNTERYELTKAEYSGLEYVKQPNVNGDTVNLLVDFRLWDNLKYYLDNDRIGYWYSINLESSSNVIFSQRDIYNERNVFVGDSAQRIDANSQYLNQIYDSGPLRWMDWRPIKE